MVRNVRYLKRGSILVLLCAVVFHCGASPETGKGMSDFEITAWWQRGTELIPLAKAALASPTAKREIREKDFYNLRVTPSDATTSPPVTFLFRTIRLENRLGQAITTMDSKKVVFDYFEGRLKAFTIEAGLGMVRVDFFKNDRPKSLLTLSPVGKIGSQKEWDETGRLLKERFITVPEPMKLNALYNPPRPADMKEAEREMFQEYQAIPRRYNDSWWRGLKGKIMHESDEKSSKILILEFTRDNTTGSLVLSPNKRTTYSFHQYSNGMANGWWYENYPSGRPRSIWKMKDGKKSGALLEFYPDGMPKAVMEYDNDHLLAVRSKWSENGQRLPGILR